MAGSTAAAAAGTAGALKGPEVVAAGALLPNRVLAPGAAALPKIDLVTAGAPNTAGVAAEG